jgi:MoxR-like ATPase
VQTEDLAALALPVLRHRILTNFAAVSEGVTTDKVVERIVKDTPLKESDLTRDARFQKIFAT